MNVSRPSDAFMTLPFARAKAGDSNSPVERRLRGFGWLPNRARNHFIAWSGEFVGYSCFFSSLEIKLQDKRLTAGNFAAPSCSFSSPSVPRRSQTRRPPLPDRPPPTPGSRKRPTRACYCTSRSPLASRWPSTSGSSSASAAACSIPLCAPS